MSIEAMGWRRAHHVDLTQCQPHILVSFATAGSLGSCSSLSGVLGAPLHGDLPLTPCCGGRAVLQLEPRESEEFAYI
jgi:hypothetical protein